MIRLYAGILTAGALLFTILLPVTPALAAHCGFVADNCAHQPVVTSGGYVYDYDAVSQTLSRAKPRSGERVQEDDDPREWEYAYTPTCSNNSPPDEDGVFSDASCLNAVNNAQCPPAQFAMWAFRRLVGPAEDLPEPGTPGPWDRLDGVQCIGADETWSVGDLTAMAETRIRQYLEENAIAAGIAIQPEGGSLVNLPVLVHTEPAPPIGFDVTEPVPAQLRAEASYAWDFGDGVKQEGAGQPYTESVSPLSGPVGYYISHPYSTTGTHDITLTTTWEAQFTVADLTIPLDPIVFTDTASITVREARSELIAGEG